MSDSILTSTKNALGLAEDYTAFDPELIMHINATLATLTQLGIGPLTGMTITDKTATWSEFLTRAGETVPDPRLNGAQSLTYLKVKMLFDPPTVGYVVTAYEKLIEEQTWRLMVAQDEVVHPYVEDANLDLSELEDQLTIVLDGGTP